MPGSQGGSQGAKKVHTHQASNSSKSHANPPANSDQPDYEKETLRPLTIRQILQAEEVHTRGEVVLDGAELTRVSFVGQVRNIARQPTKTTFKMDDGTGMLEASDWNDVDAPMYDERGNAVPENNKDPVETGDWAKVNGSIKFLQGRKYVKCEVMKKIRDKNEISYHLLEATYVHLFMTKGPPEALQGAAAGDAGAANGGAYGGQQQAGGYGQQMDTGHTMGAGAARQLAGVSAAARKVFQCLQTAPQSNEGLDVNHIANVTGLSTIDAKRGADELNAGSLVFTTVDDDTYAILEG